MKKLKKHEYIASFVSLFVIGLFWLGIPGITSVWGIFDARSVDQSRPLVDGENTGPAILDIETGTGVEVKDGDRVVLHYRGQLQDGTEFGNSFESGVPFVFTTGRQEVIPGWDKGVIGMKVGGTRLLIIPPELAYGDRGIGPIPPQATLIFEVQLIAIEEK
jgi:FKBP-type peptidyl-prolyl cis-trans isomerase